MDEMIAELEQENFLDLPEDPPQFLKRAFAATLTPETLETAEFVNDETEPFVKPEFFGGYRVDRLEEHWKKVQESVGTGYNCGSSKIGITIAAIQYKADSAALVSYNHQANTGLEDHFTITW